MAKGIKSTPKNHKHRNESTRRVIDFLYICTLLMPMAIYIAVITFLFPAPNSGYIVLGLVGTLILGVGFCNTLWLVEKKTKAMMFAAIPIVAGILLVGVSLSALYTPIFDSFLEEKTITYYFLIWSFIATILVLYFFFRMTLKSSLRNRKISNSAIKKRMSGMKNFWWYKELHEEFDLGNVYFFNKIHTTLLLVLVLLHLLIGWWLPASPVISLIMCLVCITSAILWGIVKHYIDGNAILLGFFFPLAMCYAIITYTLQLWS